MEKAYKNLGFVLLLLYPLTIAGFYRSYFNKYPTFEKITIGHHIHALIATVWISMLIAQPLLIRYKRNDIHRFVGKLSYIVFPALIISFVLMMSIQFDGTIQSFMVPASDMVIMILCYGLAIYHRQNAGFHMRYMIITAMVLFNPTLGRLIPQQPIWFHAVFMLHYAILISLLIHDRRHQKDYKPYLVGICAFAIYEICFEIFIIHGT